LSARRRALSRLDWSPQLDDRSGSDLQTATNALHESSAECSPARTAIFRTRKLDARKHRIVDTVLAHTKRAGLFEAAIAKGKARQRE
jgi:hypothetical protein